MEQELQDSVAARRNRTRDREDQVMTAIELLKKDHRKVDNLFAQIEDGLGDPAAIFDQIYRELSLHADVEETLFYPELETESETSDKVQHSYKEHREVRTLLEELAAGNPGSEVWLTQLNELKESVEHHVEEEESELFPKAEEVLGDARLREIGRKIEQVKQAKQAA
jgi:hemerythrin superfamily protein